MMHIRKLSIQNIRCVGSGKSGIELDLTRPDGSLAGWTVLAGRNGTGKTTVLQAIALAIAGPKRVGSLQRSFHGWVHWDEQVAYKGTVDLVVDVGARDTFEKVKRRPAKLPLGLEWDQKEQLESMAAQPSMRTTTPRTITQREQRAQGPWADNPRGWFVAGYGPYRRLGKTAGKRQDEALMVDRLLCLFDEDAPLGEALQWLKEVASRRRDLHERLTKKDRNGETGPDSDKMNAEIARLHHLEMDLLRLIDDGLLPGNVHVDDFNTDGLVLRRPSGRTALLENFSDGYRVVASLVFDIIRQIYRSFGEFELESFPGANGENHVRALYDGVVLIDEIESHLHISWQKKIGFWFREHFPNIQFIVTTHSPFICQAASPGGLIRLQSPDDLRPTGHVSQDMYNSIVNGSIDDAIMTDLFGPEDPYSEPAEKLRDELGELEAQLLDGKATKKAKQRIEELSAMLPRSPSADVGKALRALSKQIDATMSKK